MSDDDGIDISKVRKGDKIQISLDRSAELQSVEEENARLKIEKEHLESTLETIATKEFNAQCRQCGLNPETATPEILKAELRKKTPHGGDTISWSQANQEKSDSEKTDLGSVMVSDAREAITYLNFVKNHGTESEKEDAKRLLGIAIKSQFGKHTEPLDIEYTGNLKNLLKHDILIRDGMTDEEKERIQKFNAELLRKRTAWVKRD